MSDVKLEIKPSAELIAEARAAIDITHGEHRIHLRKPPVLAQFRFVKMIGGEASTNPVYMAMVMPLLYIESIDDDPVTMLNDRHLDALITRLDEDGVTAVQEAVTKHFGAPDPDADKANLKK